MFSLKNKLCPSLKAVFSENCYKNYRVIIKCNSLQENIEKRIISSRGRLIRSIKSINCISAYISAKTIEKLLEFPEVKCMELDKFCYVCGYSILAANNVPKSGKYRLTGKGIRIGIVDTGVYPHTDLTRPFNKIIHFEDLINNYKYPYDDNGHGTFMSGIICGSGYSSKGMYKGISEGADLYMVKAFNSLGRACISDTLYAIENIINASEEHNIKVICLPFETTEYDPFILSLYSALFDKAIEKGITIIVPSGSNSTDEGSITGISTLNNCITVGGLDSVNSANAFKYSSSGPFKKSDKPDLSAACVNICSLNTNKEYVSERNGSRVYPRPLDEPYTNYEGTSCAAAFISGVCALLYENNPNMTFRDMNALLKVSCKIHEISKWIQGAGTPDLDKLLP